MHGVASISAGETQALLAYPLLVDVLGEAFANAINAPERSILDVPGGTMLLMPAWNSTYVGVKIATVYPGNGAMNLPATASTYILMDGRNGRPILLIDGPMLTHRRTAAASALASRYLSCADSQTLLMVGAGALAPHLIEAHCSVRPISRVLIWARDPAKAAALARQVTTGGIAAEAASTLEAAVSAADIISCATLSVSPLVKGAWLRPGQHLDLVGGFTPQMRESDDEAVARARLFADTLHGVWLEAGDLLQPLAAGVISRDAIEADLFALAQGTAVGRQSPDEITLFKSVGASLEDLAAASLIANGRAAHAPRQLKHSEG